MDSNEAAELFGIAGDFPGDKELLQELKSCGEAFLSSSANKPPLARLVSFLGSLPLKGRYAFVRKYLATSPHRDAILRDLFDYCFQQNDQDEEGDVVMAGADDDTASIQDEEFDEFVLIGNPLTKRSEGQDATTEPSAPLPLNLKKFHIFQVVIVLMAVSGPAGAEMSRRYLNQSSSTKYRPKILVQCIECFPREEYSDDELLEQYQISPRSVQDKIVDACKHAKKNRQRKDFLRRVYEQDSTRHPDLLYWLDTEYVSTKMESLMNIKFGSGIQLKHWGAHGDTYLACYRRKMEECQQNKLQLGSVWAHLTGRLELKSIQERHLKELIQMWEGAEPCFITGSAPQDARKYLQGLSDKGEDVSNFTNEVHRYDLHSDILIRLSKKEQLNLAIKYLRAKDWRNFDMIQRLCPQLRRHKLPYKEAFAQVSADDMWQEKSWSEVNPFLNYFWSAELYEEAGPGKEKTEVLQAWSDMLLRCKPSDMRDITRHCVHVLGQKPADRWRWWYNSYCLFFGRMSFSNGSECLQADAEHAQQVLKLAMGAYNLVSSHLPSQVAVTPVLDLLKKIPYALFAESTSDTARAVAEECVQILAKTVLPTYSNAVQFEPTDTQTYVSNGSINKFNSTMSSLLSNWGSSREVLESVSSAVLDMSARASNGLDGKRLDVVEVDQDEQSPPASKRRKFVYYNYSLHHQVVTKCFELAKMTLVAVINAANRSIPVEVDSGITKQLWNLVRQRTMADAFVGVYLDACLRNLPNHMLADEKKTIISRSRASILSTYKSTPHRWQAQVVPVAKQLKELGFFESVLEDEDVPSKVRDTMLIDHAGFANEKARQSLKDATYVADGDSRAEGITTWLAEACKTGSLDLIVEALAFAEGRIKNEAGPNRKSVFAWLESHFVNDIVMKSLNEDADVRTVEKLCSSITSILKNDISRLDCVSRQVCFPRLPALILEKVLAFDPALQRLAVRQLWVRVSICLHWELQAALSGTESLSTYSWPLSFDEGMVEFYGSQRFELKSASWISEEACHTLYPPTEKSKTRRQPPSDVEGLVRKRLDIDNAFGPVQCVDMLATGLREVWSDDIPAPFLLVEGRFPETEELADALRNRIEALFYICGPAWQEVPLLTQMFDGVFDGIEDASPLHFSQACNLLAKFWHIHGKGVVEVQRIVDACDKVFKVAVASNWVDIVQVWLPHWKEIFLAKGRRLWDVQVDDRTKSFVHRHCQGREPKAWRLAMSKTDQIRRESCLMRELLDMSSSALLLDYVRDTLFDRRQDVLLRYLGKGCDLQGVFRSKYEARETLDEILFDNVTKEQLLGCSAVVCRRYAQYSLAKATSNRCDLRSRIKAIGEFMGAPSTQPADVLAALQSDLEEAVREALINRVFSLDSPWHILGFLLSQKAIEKNDQRITSALLGYVARHVPLDKVVLVVGHLLKKSRRKKLGFQLHKAAIRMLFESKTDVAMEFLHKEWDYDLHDSVRTLMIQKCIEAVVGGKVDGWEASVLMDVASSDSIETDLKFCLFAPVWQDIKYRDFGSLAIKHPEDVLADDMLDLFRKKDLNQVTFNKVAVAEALRSVMEKLEFSSEGSLQLLARIKKFSLSNLFGSFASDNQGALDEMMSIITRPVDFADHKIQVERRLLSELFAYGATKVITQKMMRSLRPSIPEKELEDLCSQVEVTTKLRSCVRTQLDAALDLPIRKHLQRAVHLDSLEYLLSTVASFVSAESHLSRHNLHHLLVIKPFEKEVAILKKDESHVSSAVGSY